MAFKTLGKNGGGEWFKLGRKPLLQTHVWVWSGPLVDGWHHPFVVRMMWSGLEALFLNQRVIDWYTWFGEDCESCMWRLDGGWVGAWVGVHLYWRGNTYPFQSMLRSHYINSQSNTESSHVNSCSLQPLGICKIYLSKFFCLILDGSKEPLLLYHCYCCLWIKFERLWRLMIYGKLCIWRLLCEVILFNYFALHN